MPFLAIGIILAALLLLLMHWWSSATVASAKRSLIWPIIGVCLLLALVLLATGKALLAVVPAGYAVLRMFGPMAASKLLKNFKMGKAGFGGPDQSGQTSMGRAEALEVLGLEDGATETEVNDAFRRLMAQVHPDKGGSDWMAAKLNDARKTLLG